MTLKFVKRMDWKIMKVFSLGLLPSLKTSFKEKVFTTYPGKQNGSFLPGGKEFLLPGIF